MREGYPLRPLSEVMSLDIRRTTMAPGTTYRLAGVLNAGQGLVAKGEFDGGDTEYSAMNVLRTDQVVMRKLTAWEGPISVVSAEFDGFVVSNEFPTFTLSEAVMPEWMRAVCESPRLWAEMKSRVTGTVQRRKRLNPDQLLQIEFPVPPPPVQQRIVEVLRAVDNQIAALDNEIRASEGVLNGMRDHLLVDADWPTRPLRTITEKIGSGATPRGGEATYVPEGVSLIRSQNVHDLAFEWAGLAHIDDAQARALDGVTVQDGDLLFNITGASVNRVCLVPPEAIPARVNQHVAIIRPTADQVRPSFLLHMLRRSDYKRELDVLSGGGSTRQAITKATIEQFGVQIPDLPRQDRIVSTLDAMTEQLISVRSEAGGLRALRAGLVSALLMGEIEFANAEGAA